MKVYESQLGTRLAPLLVLAQISSLQVGSAVAKETYDQVGAIALAGMRLLFSAVIMLMLVRPRPSAIARPQWRAAVALGVVLAAMNVAYFQAIEYLPIGIASTVELLGPLLLALAMSRHAKDIVCALVAAVGLLLLAAPGDSLPVAGLLLGGLAAACRAAYILLNRKVGRLFDDWSGLTIALTVGACLLTPVAALTQGDAVVGNPGVLGTGLLVALLSSLIPYALDTAALRRLDPRTFGILLSMSPAVGAGVGFVLLHEQITVRQGCAIALVVAASAWSVRTAGRPRHPGDPARPEEADGAIPQAGRTGPVEQSGK
ncbi:EamA family transporter [Streptomyces rhizosphaericus]|uniref:EamA family transporter n=1 Tax=Streptomyces rhizosphaericus TaxID=114699 RepID=A0A6G4AWH2_9ACTN|nr:EamA family transporter [Streptomyces rhizosphaericus]NEW77725.1 EamA family transporter [Streptomyces rhizosphaericus]